MPRFEAAPKIWKISELLTSKELIAEGRQMKHCVATYSQSCFKGICTIWTMTSESEGGIEKHVTIELNRKSKVIRQVRGRMNRRPNEKEKDILRRWASTSGINIESYI